MSMDYLALFLPFIRPGVVRHGADAFTVPEYVLYKSKKSPGVSQAIFYVRI